MPTNTVSSQTDLRALVQKWRAESTRRDEAAFEMENDAPDDAGWNHGVSAGMDECADELEALLTRTEADEAATVGAVAWVAKDDPMFRDDWSATTPLLYRQEKSAFAPQGLVPLFTHPQDASAGEAVAHMHNYGDRVRVVWDKPWADFPAGTQFYAALPSPPKEKES